MNVKSIVMASLFFVLAVAWSSVQAQRGGPPVAPPDGAQEPDMQSIDNLPDDFETNTGELERVAAAAVEIQQLRGESRERPMRVLRESGLDMDKLREVDASMSDPGKEPPEELSTDELERYKAVVEAAHQAQRDVAEEAAKVPEKHGLDKDRYNMMVLHMQGDMPEEYSEEFQQLLRSAAEEAGLM